MNNMRLNKLLQIGNPFECKVNILEFNKYLVDVHMFSVVLIYVQNSCYMRKEINDIEYIPSITWPLSL